MIVKHTEITNSQLLDGNDLRQKLQSLLPQAKDSIIFISAYVTQSAIDWLIKNRANNIDTHIICRLTPIDVVTGATQISALEAALENSIRVSCLHSLHAKIYAIDNQTIFVGSSNLTNNGLKIYGSGNLEACSQVSANVDNLNFIQNIVNTATPLDHEILQSMQSCIDLKEKSTFLNYWPKGVLKEEEGIWVRDFFWGHPNKNTTDKGQIHDSELLGINTGAEEPDSQIKTQVLNTRCIKWLIQTLEAEQNNEMYFGALTKALHSDLKDDPTPYRKNVKTLLQNLLAYATKYIPDFVEITSPKHSQKIKLIKEDPNE